MNDAHLHMVVNHFPITGLILGLGVLIAGLFLKNTTIKNTAYCLFIVSAIFAFASMNTGDGAERMVEDLPNVGHEIIHEHEEMAEKLAIFLYVLGVVSIIGLYANIKNHSKAKLISFLVLLIAAVSVYFAQATGTTGGEVRHTEIRSDSNSTLISKDDTEKENKEE